MIARCKGEIEQALAHETVTTRRQNLLKQLWKLSRMDPKQHSVTTSDDPDVLPPGREESEPPTHPT